LRHRHREIPPDLWAQNPAALLDTELARERASSLGRLGRALERALQSLSEFDATHSRPLSPEASEVRSDLVAAAGHALWQLIVQREACGLRDNRAVMEHYRVPADVQTNMGAVRGRNRRR
jgi:hypothetical protein